jgi:hypothetical protein
VDVCSPAAQSTQKAVAYAVLTGLFTQAFAVKGPAVVGVMMGPESPLLPLRWVLGSTPGGSKATRVKVIATRRAMMENRLGAIFKAAVIGRCTETWPLILCVDYIDSCVKV